MRLGHSIKHGIEKEDGDSNKKEKTECGRGYSARKTIRSWTGNPEKRTHSYRRDFTGSAIEARTVWKLTVSMVTETAKRPENTNTITERSTR